MKNKDKFRLYFIWRGRLYEKWVDIDYPLDLLNNSEHKQAYIHKNIVPKGMKILEKWYKEITSEDYPFVNTQLREITINEDISAEDALEEIDKNKL